MLRRNEINNLSKNAGMIDRYGGGILAGGNK